VITIDVDPTIEIGPMSLAWHGMMIAVGIITGGWLALRYVGERELDRDPLLNAVLIIALAGIIGARLLYLVQNDATALLRPGEWIGSQGFAFYGALVLGIAAVAVYLWCAKLTPRYLDALAAGFPLGMALGRIGDLINGEHYGPVSSLPWAVRWPHPEAEVPENSLAYHSGGLYEIVLALAILAVVWPLRRRFRRPTMLLWAVVALYGTGRFVMFFYRSDADPAAVGLNVAQLESLALIAIAALGAWIAGLRPRHLSARRAE
jgi:phosphatidylglycerol:prolipoprotein diacylglycerol transferase